MTTIETLTLEQVHTLQAEAEIAGDEATATDCRAVSDAYGDSDCSELSEAIDHERGEMRAAAERIVSVIRNAEAQQ